MATRASPQGGGDMLAEALTEAWIAEGNPLAPLCSSLSICDLGHRRQGDTGSRWTTRHRTRS